MNISEKIIESTNKEAQELLTKILSFLSSIQDETSRKVQAGALSVSIIQYICKNESERFDFTLELLLTISKLEAKKNTL